LKIIDVIQGTYEWHCFRQGCVTGTTVKSALGSPKVQETLLYKIVSERMTEPQIDELGTVAVRRGQEMEPIARNALIAKTGINFQEVGMLQHDTLENFRLSPDGVEIVDGKVIGGCELKCPNSKNHVEYLLSGEVPKDYIWQVKAPFIMSDDIQYWTFASFDDRNYECPLFIKTVTRADFPEIESERTELARFLDRVNQKHLELTF
jgi:putative phage-type endonuclease